MPELPKPDASQQPAQRYSEAARAENAMLRAQGLRKGPADEAPRLVLAEPIQSENEILYKKRVYTDDELKHLRKHDEDGAVTS